jgi:arsenite methyltransferase
MNDQASTDLREEVRSRYAEAARAVLEPKAGVSASCCGSSAADSCCGTGETAALAVGGFGEGLSREGETDGLPAEAVLASLGCGNPIAVADLREGERVLDLGSGGGIDVLLSARRVGPSGYAYGVDMTDDMLELARSGRSRSAPAAVGAYIGAAYFFTSSTSFANPAITIGRMFSDTFAGIAPSSVPSFI